MRRTLFPGFSAIMCDRLCSIIEVAAFLNKIAGPCRMFYTANASVGADERINAG